MLQPVGGSAEKMVQFLQSSVGIIHKSHAESITSFVKDSVVGELKDKSEVPIMQATRDKRITFCVEGNISVGKSTFLQKIANETVELRDLVEIVPEPVSKWQNVGPDHFNILGAFYAEPQRYAYTFQNYVFVTRLMQEKESSGGIKPLRLVEQSIFSDRMVCIFLLLDPLLCCRLVTNSLTHYALRSIVMCTFVIHITNNFKQNGDAKSSRPRELVLSSVINLASLTVFEFCTCFMFSHVQME